MTTFYQPIDSWELELTTSTQSLSYTTRFYLSSWGIVGCLGTGLEIATNTVAFATQFFPLATKISGEVVNLRLVFIFAL